MASRVWWSALVAVCLAGALVIGGAAVASAVRGSGGAGGAGGAGASAASAAGAPSGTTGTSGTTGSGGRPGTTAPEGGAPAAGAGGAPSMSGMAAGSPSTGTGLCPNVKGATVMANGMVMAPVPAGPPTAAQQAAASQLVSAVEQGIARYSNVQTAEADGYAPITSRRGPMTHYVNRSVVAGGDVLDPSHPSALMYANTVDGPVLVGAMFLGPAPCVPGPDVGGSLTQWHAHDNLCASGGQIVGRASASGTCAAGALDTKGWFMLHVWTAPQLAAQYQFQADVPPSAFAAIDATGRA